MGSCVDLVADFFAACEDKEASVDRCTAAMTYAMFQRQTCHFKAVGFHQTSICKSYKKFWRPSCCQSPANQPLIELFSRLLLEMVTEVWPSGSTTTALWFVCKNKVSSTQGSNITPFIGRVQKNDQTSRGLDFWPYDDFRY